MILIKELLCSHVRCDDLLCACIVMQHACVGDARPEKYHEMPLRLLGLTPVHFRCA